MTNRKQIELDRFKEDIKRVWSLSVIEEYVLESFFNLFLERKIEKIESVQNLIAENWQTLLLHNIPNKETKQFAKEDLDMVDKEKSLADCDNEDLLDEFCKRDLNAFEEGNDLDIVNSSNLDEITSLFLSFSSAKQNEIINNLKQI